MVPVVPYHWASMAAMVPSFLQPSLMTDFCCDWWVAPPVALTWRLHMQLTGHAGFLGQQGGNPGFLTVGLAVAVTAAAAVADDVTLCSRPS